MKFGSILVALGAAVLAVSTNGAALGQADLPEWQKVSTPEFHGKSSGAMTRRVLAKVSVDELQRAAAADDGAAAWILSYAYKQGLGGLSKNEAQAYRLSRKSCSLGNMRGCDALAYNLSGGIGTAENPDAALELFNRTCEMGIASSCGGAARIHFLGLGNTPKDLKRAYQLRVDGCDYGSGFECRIAGNMQARGEGSIKSDSLAHRFFVRGCDGGDGSSCFRAGRFLERVSDRNADGNFARIAYFYERGCEIGNRTSCYNRGIIENEGKYGRTRSTPAAVPWMEKACERGFNDACYNLGSWLINGRAGRRDGKRAIELLGPLCLRESKPDIQACNNAATAAYRGSGMDAPDYASARKFYERACFEGGLVASCRTLSDMYRDGQVTAQQVGEREWLDAQLCFKAKEQAYCRPDTRQHLVLQRAGQGNFPFAASVAGNLCAEGDLSACRTERLLKACQANSETKSACRRAFAYD